MSAEALDGLRQLGGDRVVVELLETYLGHTPERMRRLDAALEAADREEVVKAAHSLKSGSLSIGATAVAELAGQAERQARGGRLEDVQAGRAGLRREVRKLLRGIEAAIREIRAAGSEP